ncbi:MAG: tryptophan-rich sensory protein [Gammaproteobacteria bacterium]|nr:tryptophan-rich sensory protein [Gammaproteobacteria bacterium]
MIRIHRLLRLTPHITDLTSSLVVLEFQSFLESYAIIANTILFWRIDRLAGALFVPYVLWVVYATVLNASLWRLN